MWNRKVFVRIIEVLLCIACVVALRVTDDESRRVFHYLRSRSREWSLLNNVTWGAIGAALASVTCGGYVIITTGLLVAAATGELRGRKTELFLLGLGIILFAIVGALSLASIESVPESLIDNAAVLGSLCLLTALVFIADLLMGSSHKKEKPLTIQLLEDKKAAKPQLTATVVTENESKSSKPSTDGKPMDKKDTSGDSDRGFDKTAETHRSEDARVRSDDRGLEEDRLVRSSNYYPENGYRDERDRNYGHVERELREYTQNVENERALRDSQRYRDAEMQRGSRDSYDSDTRMMYRRQDIYQRPVDEVDTPRFPMEMEYRAEPVFAKIINPGVKIMRVERDVDDEREKHRYSDNSQYDNVPTKLRGSSTGILKKGRDTPSKVRNARAYVPDKDDIEMLEECFEGLKTTSTGTQTGARLPPTPNDPGYVRHTASNWPHELKAKTPGSSPDHSRHH